MQRIEHLIGQLAPMQNFQNLVRALRCKVSCQVAMEHLVEVGTVVLADLVDG